MTDANLLTLIKDNAAYKSLADQGLDNQLSDAINAAQTPAAPLTIGALEAAAPQTLAAIGAGSSPEANLDVLASRVRAGDAAGVGSWADTLLLLKTMPQSEHDAVEALVSAAATPDSVTHQQVSRVLNPIRPVGPQGQTIAIPITWPS